MDDLFAWVISFFLLIAVIGSTLYQIICLADLHHDYLNAFDTVSKVNYAVLPEFVVQGAVSFVHLMSGHWIMLLLCLPCTFYNVNLYIQRQHLLDVTEIFNQLAREMNIRMWKLGYMAFLMIFTIAWLVMAVAE